MENKKEFEDDVPMSFIEERLEKLERSCKTLHVSFIILIIAVIIISLVII